MINNRAMMNKYKVKGFIIFMLFLLCIPSQSFSQQLIQELHADTIPLVRKDNYWNRLFHGHIDRTFEKKVDMSYVAAPSYTREASFGIGGMATGLYRLDRTDSLMPPSNFMLTFNASIKGFYAFTFGGNNNFKGNRSRLSYQAAFFNKNLDFWGIDYDNCDINPVIGYKRQTVMLYANYQYEFLTNFYAGANIDFLYNKAAKIDNISYLQGQNNAYTTTGLGFSLQYDSRDFIPNPQQGMYILLRETVYPKALGDVNRTLWRTTFTADFYQKIWQGGILAFDLYGQVSSDNLPWTLREELGGTNRMRGYYSGRYIDNNIASTQVELRQHIAGRLGFATWIGAGTVFPTLKDFEIKKILPTYGLGLHLEVKHNMNARVDFGFGKGSSGFVFGIGTAF